MVAMISNELLRILACPACKGALAATSDGQDLLCRSCGVSYPVRDDIPVLLVSEARLSGE